MMTIVDGVNHARFDLLQLVSLGNNQSLECVDKLCCMGDMIAEGGGAEVKPGR